MIALLLIPAAMLLTGITLVVRGVRGRAIDDHPVCRRCRFDLFGLPTHSTRCSECGADLSGAHAVLAGNRRRRTGVAVVGSLLIVPAVLAFGLFAYSLSGNVNWIEYAPHWYLLRQATNSLPAVHDPALAELSRRQSLSLLSNSQIDALVDTGLALQSNRSAPWVPAWGDIIESAHTAGKVPLEKWKGYLTNVPSFSLVTRPQIRRGDRLVLRVLELPARCGSRASLWVNIRYDTLPDSDLVTPGPTSGSMGSTISVNGSGSGGNDLNLSPELLRTAADGPKSIHVKLVAGIYFTYPNGSTVPPDATTTVDLRTNWTLVPADAPTIHAIPDPSQQAAMQAAIKIERVEVQKNDPNYVSVNVRMDHPPMAIAHAIFLRAGGQEWPLWGGVSVLANASISWGTGGQVKDFHADRVDVILRPDAATAVGTVDIHDYWDGEIVVKDVAVRRPPEK